MRNGLLRGALAGAVAGLLTSIAAYFWLEPLLEAAIALEGPADGPVSRQTQRLLGLPAGFLLVGLGLGLLFGLVYRVLPSTASLWRRSVGLAVGAFTALALIPQLRYPANPPGVGDASTITDRTSSYLLAVALGVGVVSGAYALLRNLRDRGVPEGRRQSAVAVAALFSLTVGFLLLPDAPDAVEAPAQLVYDFRLRSLGLQALLYGLLGVLFAVFGGAGQLGRPRKRPLRVGV